jgi:DNA adenine methylase
MGGVFLRRDQRPSGEVINDYNKEVSNLFRILQCHYVAFLDVIRWQITTRAEFNRLCNVDPETLTDLQRAARFLYLQKLAFGGKVSGKNYGIDKQRPARFDLTKLQPMLEDLHLRLSGVAIECLDYKVFLRRYDGKDTLFYLDPPYFGCESDYGKALFSRDEFRLMVDILKDLKGTFILSLNDHLTVRELFRDFHICDVKTSYSIAKQANMEVGELLISNVDLRCL